MSDWTPEDQVLAERDWSQVPAGEEMDKAIYRLNVEGSKPLPFSPSRNALAALAFLECLCSDGAPFDVRATAYRLSRNALRPTEQRWHCQLIGQDWHSRGYGDTLALAACRAMLDYETPGVPGRPGGDPEKEYVRK